MSLVWALRSLALGMGAAHTVVAMLQQSMNEDGINYLDVGTAFVQGDWAGAISPIWSPLYAWTLGAALWVVRPSITWEFPVVHVVNFLIFALALFAFEFFWRQLGRHREPSAPSQTLALPEPAWTVLGYSLFIWSSLGLVEIWAVTPDMAVAALVYVAAGLVLRATQGGATASHAALLGVVLGLGYLAKAALLPLGVACIVLFAGVKAERGRFSRLAVALVAFLMVAAPLVVALSTTSGRLTFGEVGRFTYMKHVNGLRYPYWGSTIDRVDGAPAHPPRQVFDDPDVYEFATPVGGSYPLAFDPSYWTAGLAPRIDLGRQLRASLGNARFYFELFLRTQGAFVAGAVLLVAMALLTGMRPPTFSAEAVLVVWALCAFGLYSMVFVTYRYIAPFVVIFWAAMLAPLRLPAGPAYRHLDGAVGVLLILVTWINIAAFNAEGLAAALDYPVEVPTDATAVANPQPQQTARGSAQEVAVALRELGVRDGDRVGFIGYSYSAYWARLARVRIVAEITPEQAEAFWAADAHTQAEALRRFDGAGAAVVVAEPPHTLPVPPGWAELGTTGYLVHQVAAHAARDLQR